MPATLRRGGANDAQALAALAERTFRDVFGARSTPENMERHCARAFGPEVQARELADAGLVTMLAAESGRLVGFSQLYLSKPHACIAAARPAELHRIYVSSEWQGRGVAQSLMRNALDTAASGGSDLLWLGVWEHNPKAIAFYRKFGFEILGDQPFMLGQDRQRDLIMAVGIG